MPIRPEPISSSFRSFRQKESFLHDSMDSSLHHDHHHHHNSTKRQSYLLPQPIETTKRTVKSNDFITSSALSSLMSFQKPLFRNLWTQESSPQLNASQQTSACPSLSTSPASSSSLKSTTSSFTTPDFTGSKLWCPKQTKPAKKARGWENVEKHVEINESCDAIPTGVCSILRDDPMTHEMEISSSSSSSSSNDSYSTSSSISTPDDKSSTYSCIVDEPESLCLCPTTSSEVSTTFVKTVFDYMCFNNECEAMHFDAEIADTMEMTIFEVRKDRFEALRGYICKFVDERPCFGDGKYW